MNYSVFAILPFLISAAVIPLLIFYSKKKKLLDYSDGDNLKIHKLPTSFLGGLAMFSAAAVCLLLLSFFDSRFVLILLACLPVFLLGIYDDLKWKHVAFRKPYLKFCFLVLSSAVSAIFLYYAGVQFYIFPAMAFLYVFALINAVNYQDGIDAQAGILVFISLLGFSVLSLISADDFSLKISFIFAGAVLGFLIYNFPPAKIFMGDSGAYMLGFALAVLALIFSQNILSHLFIIGLPLVDGIYTNARRLLKSKSIFLGDRGHFYDKMIERGFSLRKTILISALFQAFFVITGIILFVYV